MSANVISHQEPRRKRAGVTIVALAGVIAASWLAIMLQHPTRAAKPTSAPAARFVQPQPEAPAAAHIEAEAADLARPPPRRTAVRTAQRPSGIPLDASGAVDPAGYEILSAGELDGISQARE